MSARITFTATCRKHPRYQAIHFPRRNKRLERCSACLALYWLTRVPPALNATSQQDWRGLRITTA